MEHQCEALDHIPKTESGSYELYSFGDELTFGQDIMVEMNVSDNSSIDITRWFLKDGYMKGNFRSHRIAYCPFCGEKLEGNDEERK